MPGSLRINRLRFKAGTGPQTTPLDIAPGPITIFVGPNNSGKSLALREIENWCFGKDAEQLVIDSIEIDFPTDPAEARALISRFRVAPPAMEMDTDTRWRVGQYTFRTDEQLRSYPLNPMDLDNAVIQRSDGHLRPHLSSFYTVRLDGRTRFALTDSKESNDLQQQAKNHLVGLFIDDAAREEVRRLTEEAFGMHFVIDPTGMNVFRIRMSPRAPRNKGEEQSLNAAARRFHSKAPEISKLSDGVKAFVGLISAVMSLPHKILLIDEPEAFLHPPLARRLGANLSQIADGREASLMVSTHSAEFLKGCLESNANTSVVRLTYEGGTATAHVLPAADLSDMIRDPLLRSSDVLASLFHRAAIITEADADRAFYDEINYRLLAQNRGIKDALFLNTQNKQTLRRLIGPLRRIGIPVVGIPDLDMLKISGEFSALLDSANVPAGERARLEAERGYFATLFSGLPNVNQKEAIKSGGINNLNAQDKVRAEALLENLAQYGIFLVPVGELEAWLPQLGIVAPKKADWITSIFTRMGYTGAPGAMAPRAGDVWDFIDSINRWIENPTRLGMQ